MDFNKGALILEVQGSGEIVVSGQAKQLHAQVLGSGNVEAGMLIATAVDASVCGSGSIRAYASSKAEARVTGSGQITIYGEPVKTSTKGYRIRRNPDPTLIRERIFHRNYLEINL